MADTNETSASKIDITSTDFRTSGCSWCHPGGGSLEYDRNGHRFDGAAGLFQSGANPTPKTADYYVFGTLAGADASAFAGPGFFEITTTTGLYPPEQLINQGTVKAVLDPATGTTKTVGKKYASVAAGGVAETDCMMCHLSGRYANLERNYAFPAATMPKLAASLGLVGQGTGNVGLLNIGAKGTPGTNPNPALTAWSWNEFIGIAGTPGNPVTFKATDIAGSPKAENCAACHFPDRSMASAGCADPTKCGPSSKPLGFTAFQKYMAPGSTRDGDEIPGVNGRDGNNDVAWNAVKGRVEGGKRGESLNDNLNHDAHMKWPASGQTGMACAQCHYNVQGDFAALTDAQGNVIQPAINVQKIDHQFAKGDNQPDGKNMDQLDNTVTCQSCHIDFTHPNAGNAPNPAGIHAGMPALHFDKLSCKTCHIPILNGPVDQDLADFTVGPYQTFERTETKEAPTTGINRRPLLLWRSTEHGKGHMEIQPFGLMTVPVVANATAQVGDEASAVTPTFQRLGKRAGEQLRTQYGDANGDGVYDWPLNALQAGDKTLIVNKPQELRDYIAQIATIPGAPANPVIHFYFNQFSISHNTRPRNESTNMILGSKAGGGCSMCHASSNPADPNYSPSSVGFFDRTYQLFTQPVDGGAGLVQTVTQAAAPLTGNLERISIKFPIKKSDGSSASINLSQADGETVRNSITQSEALGYDAARATSLMTAKQSSYTVTASAGANGTVTPAGSITVNAGRDQTITVKPGNGYSIADVLVDGVSVGAVSSYTFSYVVADHTLSATFIANPTFTVTAIQAANGTITPTGVSNVLGGTDIVYTITPDTGYRTANLIIDGVTTPPYSTYYFRNVDANHTISATFVADSFAITSSVSGSGTISPAGVTQVPRGASQTYTITANPGYRVSRVVVDGVNKGALTTYTFTNVTSPHTIKAYFQRGSSSESNTSTSRNKKPRR